MTKDTADGTATARYYTRGVRFPRLIGQTHDGTRIPGGPYTLTQGVGGLVAFLGGWWTRPLWGNGNLLRDYLLLFLAVGATVFALRFVRTSGRDPITAGTALASVYLQPRHGRLRGRSLRIARPHPVRGRPVLLSDLAHLPVPGLPAPAPAGTDLAPRPSNPTRVPAPTAPAPPTSTPNPPERTAVLSGVGQLLAASAPGKHPEKGT
jgi:hypothetical protein